MRSSPYVVQMLYPEGWEDLTGPLPYDHARDELATMEQWCIDDADYTTELRIVRRPVRRSTPVKHLVIERRRCIAPPARVYAPVLRKS